jgi:hypothetical protein
VFFALFTLMNLTARFRMFRAALAVSVLLLLTGAVREAEAQEATRLGLILETAGVWSNRNDVRIPPESGTEFSIVDLIGVGPTPTARVEGTVELNRRHGLRFVYAPLRVSGSGVPSSPIAFADGRFAPIRTDADYQFDSYRLTYRYRFYSSDTWQWKVGFTGFVRDARIALTQPGVAAEDTDIGFVPLVHLSGEAALSPRWRFRLELDGSAAPQGRAFDVLAALEYTPTPRTMFSAGYRTIEGGADVDAVYTFAWLNAVVARAGIRF